MSIFWGAAFVDREDEREDGIFIPRIPPLFRVRFLLLVFGFDLDFGLLLDLLPMFMPGMFCMSCCAKTGAAAMKSKPAMAIAQNLARNLDLKLFMVPS
jgi:hypothetical protein